MPDATPSSWAERLCDWIDDHGFSILNPLLIPTRKGIKENKRDAVLDLVMANEAVCWFGHIGPVEISEAEALGSDHAALLFSVIPSDHPSHLPDPSPAGYRADDEQHQAWSKAFSTNLPYEPDAYTDETGEARLWRHLKAFDAAIETLHVHAGTGGKGQGGFYILSPIPLYLYPRA
jgi:hypothetical protein